MVHLSTEHNKNPGKLIKAKRSFYNLKSICFRSTRKCHLQCKSMRPGFTFRVKNWSSRSVDTEMLMRTMVSLKNEDIVNKAIAKKICLRKRRILKADMPTLPAYPGSLPDTKPISRSSVQVTISPRKNHLLSFSVP